jgi:hypothetical protein
MNRIIDTPFFKTAASMVFFSGSAEPPPIPHVRHSIYQLDMRTPNCYFDVLTEAVVELSINWRRAL